MEVVSEKGVKDPSSLTAHDLTGVPIYGFVGIFSTHLFTEEDGP